MIAQESLLVTLVKLVDQIAIPPRLLNEDGDGLSSLRIACS